ncbi:cysteine desulfurase family protein [Balneolales bacterium ANBcel1]|nr:cysteine desulfurase family protein [Balneolales bacterium ANBcel1]
MPTVYFDHAATTPLDPRVLDAMLPFLKDDYGNPSSIHHMGRKPNVYVETFRGRIARAIGAEPAEIIFTSGGTEGNNAAIFGTLKNRNGKHIVTARTEHNAVLHPVEEAVTIGYTVTYAGLDETGMVTPEALEEAITPETALVSLMHVNNETGTVNPVADLAAVCSRHGIPFHCDTVQSIGKIPVNVDRLGVDMLTMSAHKFNGPNGAGALYVRGGTPWSTWMHGGSQERARRGGTLNAPGIAGMGRALELALEEMEENTRHIARLKRRMVDGLRAAFGDTIRFNGDPDNGMHHIVSVTVTDNRGEPLDGEMLLLNLDMEGICCSNGSACTSGTVKPSHVMLALGYNEALAKSTLRFSIGKTNTAAEVDQLVDALKRIVDRHSVPA